MSRERPDWNSSKEWPDTRRMGPATGGSQENLLPRANVVAPMEGECRKLAASRGWTRILLVSLVSLASVLSIVLLVARLHIFGYGIGGLLFGLKSITSLLSSKGDDGSRLDRPVTILDQGRYIGTVLPASDLYPKPVEAFRGIPYARSTAGEGRFRPPRKLPSSGDEYDAISVGPECPGMTLGPEHGEDCLNLNLYRPAGLIDQRGCIKTAGDDYGYGANMYGKEPASGRGKALLPVVIYVHGGAFITGEGRDRNMASFLAWAEKPMVTLGFNYRLGPLGFLPSALTAKEGLLNLGLRDQQMLFEWVRENIEAFGGDPHDVTLMGVSAGAHSIGHHLIYYAQPSAPPAPFAKAILESGATTARSVFSPTHPRHLMQFREFLVAAHVAGVAEKNVFNRLRQLPLKTIISAAKTVWKEYVASLEWPFQPAVDGPSFMPAIANKSSTGGWDQSTTGRSGPTGEQPALPLIPDLPYHSWRNGTHLRIPVLTGFNTNEGVVFIPEHVDDDSGFRTFFSRLIPSFSASDLDALSTLYPDPVTYPKSPYQLVPRGKGKQYARLDAAYGHYAYICPVLLTAHHLASAGVPVYTYQYAAQAHGATANHGDETPVVTHDVGVLGVGKSKLPGLTRTAERMHGAFSRFVLWQDPNGPTGNEWPLFRTPFDGGPRLWGKEKEKEKEKENGDDGLSEQDGKGRIMVFGEGNNEREGEGEGKKKPGRPMRVRTLTRSELDACRFWWERSDLSEGSGTRPENHSI